MAADLHRIREMLLNLVTNAVKYTPTGGTVAIALAEEDDTVDLYGARLGDRHRSR